MNTKEMNARLSEMPSDLRDAVLRLIREGYGANGIKFETYATTKQINACFAYADSLPTLTPID
jgi:hypothetical protein